jgi:hypothetical protein
MTPKRENGESGETPIISDFLGSATVSVASVGVSPTEFTVRNGPTCWVSHRSLR